MYEYPFMIRKLTDDEGGGYLATAFDLEGCNSDGETPFEAVENLQDAIKSWILAAEEWGDEIPLPSSDWGFKRATKDEIVFSRTSHLHAC